MNVLKTIKSMYQNDFIAYCITGSNDCRRSLYST